MRIRRTFYIAFLLEYEIKIYKKSLSDVVNASYLLNHCNRKDLQETRLSMSRLRVGTNNRPDPKVCKKVCKKLLS